MPTQQYDIYHAEEAAPAGHVFSGLDEIQAYVDDLRDTWWWDRRYWQVLRIEVGSARNKGRNGSVGWYDKAKNAGRIEMAECHWIEKYVLHEVAHVIAEAIHDSKSHDPWFARTYGELMYLTMGSGAWLTLSQSFDKDKVDYTPCT